MAAEKKVLTDRALKALKPAPEGKRYVIWDATQPHLGVRVTDNAMPDGKAAVVTFIVVKRVKGHHAPVTHVLGRYPALSLADARDRTRDALQVMFAGKTPAEVEAEKRAEEARKRQDTVAVAIETFIADQKGCSLRSWTGIEFVIRQDFLGQKPVYIRDKGKRLVQWSEGSVPIWRNTPILEIKRRTIVARLDEIKAARGKHAARHALAAIRKFFNWCVDGGERFGVEVSPCDGIRAKKMLGLNAKDLRRKRVLDDAEIADVWQAADAAGFPYGPLLKLLLLTGQRLNDIAHARRTELSDNARMLVVPPERYKTGIAHEVPLSPEALAVFRAMPLFTGPYLISNTGGKKPISCWQRYKTRLEQAIAERRIAEGREPMPHWTQHDLRRTVRTRLQSDAVGADWYTAERVIGHAKQGLDAVYDQGTHAKQKRDALERWATVLMEIVAAHPATSTPPLVMIAAE